MTPATTPWGEIALLGAVMMALTVLMRTAGPVPLRERLRRGFPVAVGLFFAGLGVGRMLAVPGFVAAEGWPEIAMAGGGLVCWAAGLAAVLRKA
jgi:hypothetical protein